MSHHYVVHQKYSLLSVIKNKKNFLKKRILNFEK